MFLRNRFHHTLILEFIYLYSRGKTAEPDQLELAICFKIQFRVKYKDLPPSSSGLGHHLLKVEIAGSTPAGGTNYTCLFTSDYQGCNLNTYVDQLRPEGNKEYSLQYS